MLNHSFQLFGLRARLILEDKDGEFEVANPFRFDEKAVVIVNVDRVADAIDRRNDATPGRPVY